MEIEIDDAVWTSRATWSRVEDGFHVGSLAGEFLGSIDQQADGRYLAYDLYSRPVGHFDELSAAMRALEPDAVDGGDRK